MCTPNRKMAILFFALRHAPITRTKWRRILFADMFGQWSRPCSAIAIHQVISSAIRHAGCGIAAPSHSGQRLRKDGTTAAAGAMPKLAMPELAKPELAKTISQGIRLFDGHGCTTGYTRGYTQKAACKVVADGLMGEGAVMPKGRPSSCSASGLVGARESRQGIFRLCRACGPCLQLCRIAPTFENDGLYLSLGKR